MANRVCWHCNVKSHMTQIDGSQRHIEQANDMDWIVVGTYACDECKWHSLAFDLYRSPYAPSADDMWDSLDDPHLWLPQHGAGKEYEDVPPQIAAAASEAHSCHSINAYSASTLLARSVIEATAKAKKITTGNLYSKIDAMAVQGLLRPLIQEAAHEVRLFGNDMAHGDFEDKVTAEESAEVLGLMAEVLDEVFQTPERVARRRANREGKKAVAE